MFYLEPAELSLQAAKEIQTDEDEYLLPKSITDVQSVASDEYVRLNIEKESRENITKNTNENIGKEMIIISRWNVTNTDNEIRKTKPTKY